jgi:hypothetical protein
VRHSIEVHAACNLPSLICRHLLVVDTIRIMAQVVRFGGVLSKLNGSDFSISNGGCFPFSLGLPQGTYIP